MFCCQTLIASQARQKQECYLHAANCIELNVYPAALQQSNTHNLRHVLVVLSTHTQLQFTVVPTVFSNIFSFPPSWQYPASPTYVFGILVSPSLEQLLQRPRTAGAGGNI